MSTTGIDLTTAKIVLVEDFTNMQLMADIYAAREIRQFFRNFYFGY